MRKFLAILMTIAMLAALTVSAYALFEAEEAFCEVKFNIGKQSVAWAADGTVTPGEYYEVAIDPAWMSYAVGMDENLDTAKNLNPQLFMSWDETYVYTATVYKPTYLWNEWDDNPANMWVAGAVQLNYANLDEVSSEYRLEYGVGRSTATGNMLYTVWADGCMSGYTPTEEDAVSFEKDGVITIETRCPWDAFADEDNTGKKIGNGFNFCLVWTQGQGTDTSLDYIHTQLAEGCTGNGKHAEYFAQVTLDDVYEVAPAYTYPMSGAGDNIIAGTVIGNETGWGDNAAAGAAAAFDGNPATFFDPLGVGDGFCGMQAGETYILDKVAVLSRTDWADRFAGAMIQGSNDGENWTTLWTSDAAAASTTEYTIITEFENNTGYSMFRYFNETNHGDVAEVEFYGAPGFVEVAAFGVQEATGSFDGEAADNLFDGDENTKWCFDSTAFTEPYVIWNVENPINVTGYEIVTANDNADYTGRNPGAWTLSGSADGSAWTVIADVAADAVLQDVNFTPFTFAADAAGEYSWFKYEIKNVVGGGVCQISGLNLLTGDVTPSAAPAAEEEVEEVVEEAPAAAEVVEEAPQTFDFAIIAAVAAVVSAAGYAISKKH